MIGTATRAQLTFYDGYLSALNDCDGGERTAVIASPRLDGVPRGLIFAVQIQAIEPLYMDSIEISGTTVDSPSSWDKVSWPRSGDVTITGLCGTEEANEAYGWASISSWDRKDDLRSASIVLQDGSGSELRRLTMYKTNISVLGTYTSNVQTATLSAEALSEG